jgi:hypothetical protein
VDKAAWSEPKESMKEEVTVENWSEEAAGVLRKMRSMMDLWLGLEWDCQVGASGSEMSWKSWSMIQVSTD